MQTRTDFSKVLGECHKPAWLHLLRISGTERGILLQIFLEHDIPRKFKADQEKLFETIVKQMLQHSLVRQNPTKWHLEVRHIWNNFNNFWNPMMEIDENARPCRRNYKVAVIRDLKGKPEPEEKTIDRQEIAAGSAGARLCLLNLIKLSSICRQLAKTSDNEMISQRERMKKEKEKSVRKLPSVSVTNTHAQKKQVKYVARQKSLWRRHSVRTKRKR